MEKAPDWSYISVMVSPSHRAPTNKTSSASAIVKSHCHIGKRISHSVNRSHWQSKQCIEDPKKEEPVRFQGITFPVTKTLVFDIKISDPSRIATVKGEWHLHRVSIGLQTRRMSHIFSFTSWSKQSMARASPTPELVYSHYQSWRSRARVANGSLDPSTYPFSQNPTIPHCHSPRGRHHEICRSTYRAEHSLLAAWNVCWYCSALLCFPVCVCVSSKLQLYFLWYVSIYIYRYRYLTIMIIIHSKTYMIIYVYVQLVWHTTAAVPLERSPAFPPAFRSTIRNSPSPSNLCDHQRGRRVSSSAYPQPLSFWEKLDDWHWCNQVLQILKLHSENMLLHQGQWSL